MGGVGEGDTVFFNLLNGSSPHKFSLISGARESMDLSPLHSPLAPAFGPPPIDNTVHSAILVESSPSESSGDHAEQPPASAPVIEAPAEEAVSPTPAPAKEPSSVFDTAALEAALKAAADADAAAARAAALATAAVKAQTEANAVTDEDVVAALDALYKSGASLFMA